MIAARHNPFAPCRLERVLAFDPTLSGTTWEALERRWQELGERTAVVSGRHGSGKSTLLRAWATRLTNAGEEPLRLFYNLQRRGLLPEERGRAAQAAAAGQAVLVDGWDLLPLRDRWWLRRQTGRLLVTSHRRGWRRRLIHLHSPGPALAGELLLRAAPEWLPRCPPALLRELLAGRHGNLREVWMDLYAVASSLTELP